jgi:hypothetical protein
MLSGANMISKKTTKETYSSIKTFITTTSAEYFPAKSRAKSKTLSADLEPSTGTRISLSTASPLKLISSTSIRFFKFSNLVVYGSFGCVFSVKGGLGFPRLLILPMSLVSVRKMIER